MQKLLYFIFIFFFAVCFSENATHLQYQTNQPVILNSEFKIRSFANLPGLEMTTTGKQQLEAVLTIEPQDESNLPISTPPFDLTFILKSILIDLQANNEKIYFDTREENNNTSLYLSQVSKIVDRPIKLRVESSDPITLSSDDLNQITYELPVLKDVNPENLLQDIISYIFTLSGEDLTVGKKIDKKSAGLYSMPESLSYEISKIDNYHIYGIIKGDIDKRKFQLNKQIEINEKEKETPNVELSGSFVGKIKWNRDNALLFDLNIEYNYSALFQLGDQVWKMDFSMEVNNRSSLYNL